MLWTYFSWYIRSPLVGLFRLFHVFIAIEVILLINGQCTNNNATNALAHLSVYFPLTSWRYLYFKPLPPLVSWKFFDWAVVKNTFILVIQVTYVHKYVHIHTHIPSHSEASFTEEGSYLHCYSDIFILVYFIKKIYTGHDPQNQF